LLRLFVAVELPTEVRTALSAARRELEAQPGGRYVRWVDLDQAHLTIKFLGNTAEEMVPALRTCLTSVAAEAAPFSLRLSGVGAFPNPRRPRVIWAGLDPGTDSVLLEGLHVSLEQALAGLGFATEERPFSPHLTLGRVRQGLRPNELTQVSDMLSAGVAVQPVSFPVQALSLMSSVLRPDGPLYARLHEARLGGG